MFNLGSGLYLSELSSLLFVSMLFCLKVLARAAYLLKSRAAPAALEPILALLHSVVLGGSDVARAACATPGLVGMRPPCHQNGLVFVHHSMPFVLHW